jgi:transposase
LAYFLFRFALLHPLFLTGDSRCWFQNILLPALVCGSVIVLDNARFHQKKTLAELAGQYKCHVLFLPPYSPDLNPIENFWAWLKSRLRKVLPCFDSFDDALTDCFNVD